MDQRPPEDNPPPGPAGKDDANLQRTEVFGDVQAGGIALFVLMLQVISYALTERCTC